MLNEVNSELPLGGSNIYLGVHHLNIGFLLWNIYFHGKTPINSNPNPNLLRELTELNFW